MNLTITPTLLSGSIVPPPSKSQLHRLILAAALADGESIIKNAGISEDIAATLRCIEALGASYFFRGTTLHVTGIRAEAAERAELPLFDCGESGSTLRFLIPVALAVCGGGVFTGRGRLMERPLTPYFDLFSEKGIAFERSGSRLTIRGRLTGGTYRLPGNVSSQFFTGLLFALPLLDGPSVIQATTPVESADYIRMTLRALDAFGVTATEENAPLSEYLIAGNSRFSPRQLSVESDWSQAAFWYAAEGLGSRVTVDGMNSASSQGDRMILTWRDLVTAGLADRQAITIDASDHPDLVPPLAALGAIGNGVLHLTKLSRLRLKESDRIVSVSRALSALGADITAGEDSLTVRGRPSLPGGTTVDCCGDHRIAMMLAIAATRCDTPVTLIGADCVTKSYPTFWEDYRKLGGIVHEHIGK